MKTETRYTHFNCMSVFDQTTSFIQVPSLDDCTCNACTFPALIHFFLVFRFWTYIAGTLVISSHLSNFKSVFSWLYFTQQGRLFYNSNWHKLLLVICYLQTAWVVPQVMSEGPNPLPRSKARSWFAKPRWCFLATEWMLMLADITISLVCVTPYTYILWRYWDSVLVPVSGPSQELICQEARNHFPDSTLFPERSRPLTIFCPLPQHTQPRAPLTESSSLWCVHFQSHA